MNNSLKILLIEDNEALRKYIYDYLVADGFSVDFLEDYEAVVKMIEQLQPSLILLDITLPLYDGFYILKLIRKHFSVPVIIISARSDEGDQIRGIENGADDYLTKPFSFGILSAKINAVLRRTTQKEPKNIFFGSLELVEKSMCLVSSALSIELTKNEFRILRILFRNQGTIVKREQLLEELWDDAGFVDDNTLNVNITRAKKKLALFGFGEAILTKRGVGYLLSEANTSDLQL